MAAAEPAAPGLVVHLFVASGGTDGDERRRRLRALWDRLGTELDLSVGTVGSVEVRTAPDGAPLRQAVLRREHDVDCLSVALTGGTWAELDDLWSGYAEDVEDCLLGECRIFVAYGRPVSSRGRTPTALAALPSSYSGMPNRQTTAGRFTVWEVGPAADDRTLRVFAVLGPPAAEAELDAWIWTSGDDRMTPLARSLMHAAKVRYELRVYGDGSDLRLARHRVDEQVEALLPLLAGSGEAALAAARAELANRQAAAAGLIWTATRVRELRRTVEIARHNLRETVFDDDKDLADWFVARLDDDLAYADAARARAREIGPIVDGELRERLQRRAEQTGRRWERFTVLQTAILGSLVMMLTAVQSLNYRLPVPDWTKPVIVAGLGGLAFVLTAVGFIRWRRR